MFRSQFPTNSILLDLVRVLDLNFQQIAFFCTFYVSGTQFPPFSPAGGGPGGHQGTAAASGEPAAGQAEAGGGTGGG